MEYFVCLESKCALLLDHVASTISSSIFVLL